MDVVHKTVHLVRLESKVAEKCVAILRKERHRVHCPAARARGAVGSNLGVGGGFDRFVRRLAQLGFGLVADLPELAVSQFKQGR